MTALAVKADVEAELGRTLTDAEEAKLDAALGAASRSVRRVTGRRYEAGTFTVRRRAFEGKVYLDQPVSVASVATDWDATALTGWTFDSVDDSVRGICRRWVRVTYTATGDIPADVVEVCAALAARRLTSSVPQGATSYTTTRGPFSDSASFDHPTDSVEPTAEELRMLSQFALPRNGPLTLGPA